LGVCVEYVRADLTEPGEPVGEYPQMPKTMWITRMEDGFDAVLEPTEGLEWSYAPYVRADLHPSREREALVRELYAELAALPDAEGNANSFLPAAVCCDLVGRERFVKTLTRIFDAILKGGEG
jgi:hypothetical protein